MTYQITQADIDRVNARKAWLEPYAKACGITYDDSDDDLMAALQAIAMVKNRQKPSRASASAGSSKATSNTAPANLTIRDQAVEIMYAKREGRTPAEWARHPLTSKGK